jgi:hypothetical protein
VADTKISALAAAANFRGDDELAIHDISIGASRKASGQQVKDWLAPLTVQEADRATDLALTTTWTDAVSLSLAAGTWLVFGQTSIESTSTTQQNNAARLRNTTDSVTYAIAEGEADSALPDRCSHFLHAVIVLAATKSVALQGWAGASTQHMIGPGNLGSETGTKVTRITAIKLA